jgi:hypothetical protein
MCLSECVHACSKEREREREREREGEREREKERRTGIPGGGEREGIALTRTYLDQNVLRHHGIGVGPSTSYLYSFLGLVGLRV